VGLGIGYQDTPIAAAGYTSGGLYQQMYAGSSAAGVIIVAESSKCSTYTAYLNSTTTPAFTDEFSAAVTALDPANPIRDIRVLMPGTEELYLSGLEFHPAFLATWVNASALRFMDMAGSNIAADSQRHTVATWAQRPTRASFSFQGRSIPIESMVHLANLLGADPWFNIHASSPPSFSAATAALYRFTRTQDADNVTVHSLASVSRCRKLTCPPH
jgi:hypothetical protein